MLKQRTAGDKNWPIVCSHATLGEADKELDLNGAHLSYGDFEEATFQAKGAIKLNGAGLAHADLSGSEFTAAGGGSDGSYSAEIDFTGANLAHTDLSGSKITADSGRSTITFTEANLASADLGGSKITADSSYGAATIDFAAADLTNANLSGSKITADTGYYDATINFAAADLTNADLSGSKITADAGYYDATINFAEANLAHADLSGSELTAESKEDDATINFAEANLAHADLSGSEITADSSYGDAKINFAKANLSNADLSDSNITAISRGGSTNGGSTWSIIDFREAILDNAGTNGSTLTADDVIGLRPIVVEDCADPGQTPIRCAPLYSGELDDAGKAKYCNEYFSRLCSRSCGLCRGGIARFESCDGARTTETTCQAGVQASEEYSVQAAKDKYCTARIQKECPVSCMGANINGGQCPVARESCADLSTTHSACQRGVQAYAGLPKPGGGTYSAEAAKNKYCTAYIQKVCPVSCMGASTKGDQCPE